MSQSSRRFIAYSSASLREASAALADAEINAKEAGEGALRARIMKVIKEVREIREDVALKLEPQTG
jgi:hypothetical protein